MDYHNSSAGTANLAVIKYTVAEPGKSKGSIFMGPGAHRRQLQRIGALTNLGKAVLVDPELMCSLPLLNP